MRQLDELTRRSSEKRRLNLERLAMMTARLDVPTFEPSVDPNATATSHSTTTPTPTSSEDRDDDAPGLRELLPERTTHGGPYGASILARVAASYGIE